MGMNVIAYKWKGTTDKHAANRMVAGFTGTLRNWWDNYITDQLGMIFSMQLQARMLLRLKENILLLL